MHISIAPIEYKKVVEVFPLFQTRLNDEAMYMLTQNNVLSFHTVSQWRWYSCIEVVIHSKFTSTSTSSTECILINSEEVKTYWLYDSLLLLICYLCPNLLPFNSQASISSSSFSSSSIMKLSVQLLQARNLSIHGTKHSGHHHHHLHYLVYNLPPSLWLDRLNNRCSKSSRIRNKLNQMKVRKSFKQLWSLLRHYSSSYKSKQNSRLLSCLDFALVRLREIWWTCPGLQGMCTQLSACITSFRICVWSFVSMLTHDISSRI